MNSSTDKDPPRKGPEEFVPSGAPGDDPLTQSLKRVYEQVVAEKIPEKWLDLLAAIDAKAAEKDDDEKDDDDAGGE
jgi:Anti-sigma factor NepR